MLRSDLCSISYLGWVGKLSEIIASSSYSSKDMIMVMKSMHLVSIIPDIEVVLPATSPDLAVPISSSHGHE